MITKSDLGFAGKVYRGDIWYQSEQGTHTIVQHTNEITVISTIQGFATDETCQQGKLSCPGTTLDKLKANDEVSMQTDTSTTISMAQMIRDRFLNHETWQDATSLVENLKWIKGLQDSYTPDIAKTINCYHQRLYGFGGYYFATCEGVDGIQGTITTETIDFLSRVIKNTKSIVYQVQDDEIAFYATTANKKSPGNMMGIIHLQPTVLPMQSLEQLTNCVNDTPTCIEEIVKDKDMDKDDFIENCPIPLLYGTYAKLMETPQTITVKENDSLWQLVISDNRSIYIAKQSNLAITKPVVSTITKPVALVASTQSVPSKPDVTIPEPVKPIVSVSNTVVERQNINVKSITPALTKDSVKSKLEVIPTGNQARRSIFDIKHKKGAV